MVMKRSDLFLPLFDLNKRSRFMTKYLFIFQFVIIINKQPSFQKVFWENGLTKFNRKWLF